MDDGHYQRAVAYLQDGDWSVAEGFLLRLRQQRGPQDLSVADALAYALLMQGNYRACAQVLEPVLSHPQRSFWIQHKYGDAMRGLHQLEAAAKHYRLALAEGSTSSLTSRNLLQVLHELEPEQALAELDRWAQPFAPSLLEGAQAAAACASGLDLVEWLHRRGLANPALQRRLIEQRCYELDLTGIEHCAAPHYLPDHDQRWCQALMQRLNQLGLSPMVAAVPAGRSIVHGDSA